MASHLVEILKKEPLAYAEYLNQLSFDELIEIEYGECKRCGRQIKQKILDANFGICPYCEMETKPHPDNPYIPNYN